jgi:hypothetical protein
MRNGSFLSRVNKSVLYLIARISCRAIIFGMIRPILGEDAVRRLANSAPEVALAKGVLVQARRDLRRFRKAQDEIGREMYADARSWIASDDLWWPYSFLNVCEALALSPALLRKELLGETQPGWSSPSRRFAQRIATSVRGSLANVLWGRRGVSNSRHSSRPVAVH